MSHRRGSAQTHAPRRALMRHCDLRLLQEVPVVSRTMETARHGVGNGGKNDGNGDV